MVKEGKICDEELKAFILHRLLREGKPVDFDKLKKKTIHNEPISNKRWLNCIKDLERKDWVFRKTSRFAGSFRVQLINKEINEIIKFVEENSLK